MFWLLWREDPRRSWNNPKRMSSIVNLMDEFITCELVWLKLNYVHELNEWIQMRASAEGGDAGDATDAAVLKIAWTAESRCRRKLGRMFWRSTTASVVTVRMQCGWNCAAPASADPAPILQAGRNQRNRRNRRIRIGAMSTWTLRRRRRPSADAGFLCIPPIPPIRSIPTFPTAPAPIGVSFASASIQL